MKINEIIRDILSTYKSLMDWLNVRMNELKKKIFKYDLCIKHKYATLKKNNYSFNNLYLYKAFFYFL